MQMKQNQIKMGAFFSYLLIIVNTFYGLLITPYVVNYLGEGDYGVYKTIASLSASLAVMDLGLGTTMTRYMARFNAKDDKQGASNFAAMVFVQFGILSLVLIGIGMVAYAFLDSIYGGAFSSDEVTLAKQLMAILILNMVLRLLENLLTGIANGYEHFGFTNCVKLVGVLLKFSLIFVLLPLFSNALLIVLLETAILTTGILVLAIYTRKNVGVKPKLKKWDNAVFKESMGYTLLMFVQTITIQFNGNIDNVLIGAQIGAVSVTIYSMALALFGMYESLSGSVASIMLPNMTRRVVEGQSPEQLQAAVERAGRFQFLLLGAALGGFLVLGKDFFGLWLGKGYDDCYFLALVLMIPVTFPMMQNVALSILRAQNKMGYRTLTLIISCVINIVISVIGIKFLGYWGAALGTAVATTLNLVFMNIYYKKHLKFSITKLFANIMKRTWICATVAIVVTAVLHIWLQGTWLSFIINMLTFVSVYSLLLIAWGLNKDEKKILVGRFVRK